VTNSRNNDHPGRITTDIHMIDNWFDENPVVVSISDHHSSPVVGDILPHDRQTIHNVPTDRQNATVVR
jgi:hypothetical protein